MPTESKNIYESRRLLDEYLLFHYGTQDEVLPWPSGPAAALGFPARSVHELLDAARVPDGARALDLGCAVGRSSFELAAICGAVIGIDYSQSFIEAARILQAEGRLGYERLDEGRRSTPLVAVVPVSLPRERVSFETGDAMNLRADLGGFDVVHAANLLCRLSQPEKLLSRLPDLVKPGGQLLLTTPCTWLEDFTPRERWPAGSTLEWLGEQLGAAFEPQLHRDLPFLIREHARKYQWSVALGMRWVRKAG